jgi:hypothetical protein
LSHFQRVLLDYIHARSTNGVLEIIRYFLFQVLGYYLKFLGDELNIDVLSLESFEADPTSAILVLFRKKVN